MLHRPAAGVKSLCFSSKLVIPGSGLARHEACHLALRDGAGKTLIAEIPKAICRLCKNHPLRDVIKPARAYVNSQLTATGGFTTKR